MTQDEVAAQARALGVREGGVLLLHTSYRAARPVAGGPAGLIAALRDALGPQGTLAVPCWTGDGDAPFDPETTPAAEDLGVVPETLRRLPGARRSAHPFAFAAIGPRADEIVNTPMLFPAHAPGSPVAKVHDLGGQVLLAGCGHDANTSLHLAELIGGAPYRIRHHVTVMDAGAPRRIEFDENDSCCALFARADGWLRAAGLQREGLIGHAPSRLFDAQGAVRLAAQQVRRDPLIFLHPAEAGCAECDLARASLG
ncbi:MAG: AAC(3) family N-acetyltransferase [Maricaulaceae bacterium]|nr:AAC(3) family N-acetyltransferase [Maricaulaceae bacterium]